MAKRTAAKRTPSKTSSVIWCVTSVMAVVPLFWLITILSSMGDSSIATLLGYGLKAFVLAGPVVFILDAIAIDQGAPHERGHVLSEADVVATVGAAQARGVDPDVALAQVADHFAAPTPTSRPPGVAAFKVIFAAGIALLALLALAVAGFLVWFVSSGASDCFLGC